MTMINLKILWKNKWHIIQGVKNKLFKKAHIERIAAERSSICAACPELDEKGIKCMMPGTQPCCGKCGCSLAFKLRDLTSECGDEKNPKWFAVK